MNRILPLPISYETCPAVIGAEKIAEEYAGFLADESRMRANQLERLYLPQSAEQAAFAIRELHDMKKSCLVSGGRTGITGATSPISTDATVSLAKMNRILAIGHDGEGYYARVEPGVSLQELMKRLRLRDVLDLPGATEAEKESAEAFRREHSRFWFPVDPTELTAHIGGAVANNASGARSYRYGAMRNWVKALKVVLPDGRLIAFRRGQIRADSGCFLLIQPDGSESTIPIETLTLPRTKATLGYPLREGMDLVDLFVGSEGTLGAIVEIELRLAKQPQTIAGVLTVLDHEEQALELVEQLRRRSDLPLNAVEYFDDAAMLLLQNLQIKNQADLPPLVKWEGPALYFELGCENDELDDALNALETFLDNHGVDPAATWAEDNDTGLERMKHFRHAVPEAVNATIGRHAERVPGLHKVGTDMAVPPTQLRQAMIMYREGLRQTGLTSVVFGHIGDCHLHVNILPETLDELARAKDLYRSWAMEVARNGGAVAAEHGIGRIKKSMLEIQYAPESLAALRRVRHALDPKGLFAPGVLV